MNRTTQLVALAVAMCLAATCGTQAAVYSFQQGVTGYLGQTDTFIDYQFDWTYNWGSTVALTVYNSGFNGSVADPGGTGGSQSTSPDFWHKMGLLRYDLSSVPADSVVSSAQLTFTVAGDPLPSPYDYSLHPILRSGLNFGTSNGATEAGTVSTLYSDGPTTGWGATDSDAQPRSGIDYGAAFATATLSGSDTTLIFNLTSQAQSWVTNPAGNLGFVLLADTVGLPQKFFYSAEASPTSFRPLLVLDAYQVPEPGMCGLLLIGSALALRWQRRRRTATSRLG